MGDRALTKADFQVRRRESVGLERGVIEIAASWLLFVAPLRFKFVRGKTKWDIKLSGSSFLYNDRSGAFTACLYSNTIIKIMSTWQRHLPKAIRAAAYAPYYSFSSVYISARFCKWLLVIRFRWRAEFHTDPSKVSFTSVNRFWTLYLRYAACSGA